MHLLHPCRDSDSLMLFEGGSEGAVAAEAIKAYREVVNRDREEKTMAADVKAFISEKIVKPLEDNNRGLIEGV